MNAEVIGTWAGQVWNALNESGKLTVKGLKKATKLKEKELSASTSYMLTLPSRANQPRAAYNSFSFSFVALIK